MRGCLLLLRVPGKHTEVMVRELGALIQDIQVMGDHAIVKWQDVALKENKFAEIKTPNVVKEQLAATVEKISETTNKLQEKHAIQYCRCGAPLSAEDVFCGNCGSKAGRNDG